MARIGGDPADRATHRFGTTPGADGGRAPARQPPRPYGVMLHQARWLSEEPAGGVGVSVWPTVSELQLDLTVQLPEMDAGDRCVRLLTDWLHSARGVDHARVVRTNGTAELSVQFDPNLVSLA